MLRKASIVPGFICTSFKVTSFTRVPASSTITALKLPSTCLDSPIFVSTILQLLPDILWKVVKIRKKLCCSFRNDFCPMHDLA